MDEKIKILCYGDSNTEGVIPATSKIGALLYGEKYTWTGIMKNLLGPKYELDVDGVRGGTVCTDDNRFNDRKVDKNRSKGFIDLALADHYDMVIVMLGTNDLKSIFNNSAKDINDGLDNLYIKPVASIDPSSGIKIPKMVIVSPPIIDEEKYRTYNGDQYIGAAAMGKELDTMYKELADQYGISFISGKELEVGEDGIHLSTYGHTELGFELVQQVIETYEPSQEEEV